MRIGKVLLTAFFFAVAVFSSASQSFLNETITQSQDGPFNFTGSVNWGGEVLQIKGIGAPPVGQEGFNKAQMRPMAIRAAKVVALRDLVEVVNGVRVSSETTVKNLVTESDVIKTKVEGFIKGFSVSEPKYLSDGTVEVIVSLPMYGKSGLAAITLPAVMGNGPGDSGPGTPTDQGKGDVQERLDRLEQMMQQMQQKIRELEKKLMERGFGFLTPGVVYANPIRLAQNNIYTGLIIDGANPSPGIRPAMAPKVLTQSGKEVYGTMNIDAEVAIEQGVASYTGSVEDAKKLGRVGDNPLVVPALDFEGAFKANPVISDPDGERILKSNLVALFPNCPVAIVTN